MSDIAGLVAVVPMTGLCPRIEGGLAPGSAFAIAGNGPTRSGTASFP